MADELRIGRRIRVPEVELVAEDGAQLGIMPTHEALRVAEERGLDLVEVAPQRRPPVCRLLDYGKYKYLKSKKEKGSSSAPQLKEVTIHPKISPHDLGYRIPQILGFLEQGHPVRVACKFSGREVTHPEIGRAHLEAIVKAATEQGYIADGQPRMEGRFMAVMLRSGKTK